MKSARDVPAKKCYQPPKLVVYGDLAEITKTTANNPKAMLDGGSGSMQKTL